MNTLVTSLVEHLTELITATDIICDNCGWEWSKEDGGDDLYICHKCGYDNTPDTLNELGEGTAEPFRWNALGDIKSFISDLEKMKPEYGTGIFQYTFKSDSAEYVANVFSTLIHSVNPKANPNLYVSIGFDIKNGNEEITNYQEQYRVMATMLKIVADFINTVDTIEGIDLKEVQLYPQSDESKHRSSIDSKRGKLYKEYLAKNLNKFNKEYTFRESPSKESFVLYPVAKPSVNENQTKAWNLKEGIVFLSKYMLDNGLNIKPLPKIKFISNDEENASNMFGKTAYYNPTEKSITLFTLNRHPKDVLRSFSHEMIHHMQNLDNRLNNISTTNTNEDGDLPELEREAYEKGNMMLRNWEDSLKN